MIGKVATEFNNLVINGLAFGFIQAATSPYVQAGQEGLYSVALIGLAGVSFVPPVVRLFGSLKPA